MKYFVLLMFVVLMPLVVASSIQTIPSNLNLNLTKDESKVVEIEIKNPNTYTLYDIQAEGDVVVTSSIINSLEGGENISFSITVNTEQVGDFSNVIKVIGFTRLNCSAIQTQTHDINITSGGAHPRNLEICKGDNIKYSNNYGSSIYLDIDDFDLYQGISNGNSHVQNFPNTGTVIYRIEPLIDLGYITVSEEFSNIYSPDNDGFLTLNIHSVLEETSISAEYSKTNFSMNYQEIKSGYVVITNTGTKTAVNIDVVGDWFTFDKHNFDLEPAEEKAVNFVISPTISQTSDTNKLYNRTIHINGDNINSLFQEVSIFIEYSDVAAGNLSSPEWWVKRKAFCDAFPTAPDCLTAPYIIYRDKVIYDAPPILMNMSPADVKEYLDEINGLRSEWASYNNIWKQDSDVMKQGITDSQSLSNQSLATEIENKEELKGFKDLFYIVFGTFIFLIIGGGVFFVVRIYYQKNISQMESSM